MVTQIDSLSLCHIHVLFLLPLSIAPPVSATCSLESWNMQLKQQHLFGFYSSIFLFARLLFILNWFIEFAFSVRVSPSGMLEKKKPEEVSFLAAYVCVSVCDLVIS